MRKKREMFGIFVKYQNVTVKSFTPISAYAFIYLFMIFLVSNKLRATTYPFVATIVYQQIPGTGRMDMVLSDKLEGMRKNIL